MSAKVYKYTAADIGQGDKMSKYTKEALYAADKSGVYSLQFADCNVKTN